MAVAEPTWTFKLTHDRSHAFEQTDRLRRWMSLAALVLLSATYRLWPPQSVFPRVPLFPGAASLPALADWIALVGMGLGLLVALQRRIDAPAVRTGLWLFAASALLSVCLDQHRLQPWLLQFALMAVVLARADPTRGLKLLRALTIGLYAWSAFSKLDHSFLMSEGGYLVDGLLNAIGLTAKHWSEQTLTVAVAALPAGEALLALLLSFRRTRRIGLSAAVAMHGLLLLTFSPWGLDHSWGVILWNVFFIVQDVLLFGRRAERELAARVESTAPHSGNRLATGVIVASIALPLLEPWGYFDHWPAWSLYATNHERVRVYVHADRREEVAADLGELVAPVPFGGVWCRVRSDRWSLRALGVPIYPQDRFKLGVALWLEREYDLDEKVRVVRASRAERLTGRRTSREYEGREALEDWAGRFTLNAVPVP